MLLATIAVPANQCSYTIFLADQKAVLDRKLSEERRELKGWVESAVFKVLQKKMRNRILENCSPACSEQKVAELIQQELETWHGKVQNLRNDVKVFRGYSIIVATFVASLYASATLRASLPADYQVISEIIPILAGIGIYKLASPIWDNLNALVIRIGYRLREGKPFKSEHTVGTEIYEKNYDLLRARFPVTQMEVADRLFAFNKRLTPTANDAAGLYLNSTSIQGKERAVSLFAVLARDLRWTFKEIEPNSEFVSVSVHRLFTRFLTLEQRQEFFDLMMAEIQQIDSQLNHQNGEKYYTILFKTWLQL